MARVLLVDDALYIRDVLRRALREAGHEIVGEAGDGREAIVEFGRLRPDVVVLDIVMPEFDGLSVVRAVRRMDASARVVVHSAFAYPDKVVEAIEAGATTFVGKGPDSLARVPHAVAQALADRESGSGAAPGA